MRARRWVVLGAVVVGAAAQSDIRESFVRHAHPPLSHALAPRFESNDGQWDPRVRFVARDGAATMLITDDGMTIALREAAIAIQLEGVVASAPHGEEQLATTTNYFVGPRDRWRTNVASYARVHAKDWMPGVDVVWHSGADGLEYDIRTTAGVNPAALELRITGASRTYLGWDGSLHVVTPAGEIVQRVPRVFQRGRELRARYVQRDGAHVGFDIDGFDANEELLIDPTFGFSTFVGGGGLDTGRAVAVDGKGDSYVAGWTASGDLATVTPFQSSNHGGYFYGWDAFVAKISASGDTLVYCTYLGGKGDDQALTIGVDGNGNAYVGGPTTSNDFPLANAIEQTQAGSFVTKLGPTGSTLLFSTYFPAGVNAIAVDKSGSVFVTGSASAGFPTVNALQSKAAGDSDAFITKLDTSGSAILYSTFLGGSGYDVGNAIAVDAKGDVFVTGGTMSTDFPMKNAAQSTNVGFQNAFVSVLNPSGSALIYSTYLGGAGDDYASGIAADGAGNAYVTGFTGSTGFPTKAAFQSTYGGTGDAFVTKLDATGALVYSTFLGGGAHDDGRAIAVDANGEAYVTGRTDSGDFPEKNQIYSPSLGACAYTTRIDTTGAIVYSTGLGGSNYSEGDGIAVSVPGREYVVGETNSADFPMQSGEQSKYGGQTDAFLVELVALSQAVPCTTNKECLSGFCVDGVCCDSTCGAQCQACDVSGHIGTCSPVQGPAHGARDACVGGVGVCAATCDGIDVDNCTYPSSATPCGSVCAGGSEIDSFCSTGSCVAQTPRSCNNLVCADTSKCKTSCVTNADCANGFVCAKDGSCQPGSTCIDDHTSKDANGTITDCASYKCDVTGSCKTACISVDDCRAGNVCNANNQCEAASSAGQGGCGCAVAPSSPVWAPALCGVGVLALIARRRSRKCGRARADDSARA